MILHFIQTVLYVAWKYLILSLKIDLNLILKVNMNLFDNILNIIL